MAQAPSIPSRLIAPRARVRAATLNLVLIMVLHTLSLKETAVAEIGQESKTQGAERLITA